MKFKQMKKLVISCLVVLIASLSIAQSRSAPNPDIETIRNRIVATLMEPSVDDTRVKEMMATPRSDGTWPGIDYANVARTAFEHTRHLSNMVLMSRAYKNKPFSTISNY